MSISSFKLRFADLACAMVLGVSASLLVGCYEHVIRAEGPRGRGVDTYEPNLKEPEKKETPVRDDTVFGPVVTDEAGRKSRRK